MTRFDHRLTNLIALQVNVNFCDGITCNDAMLLCRHFFDYLPVDEFKESIPIFGQRQKLLEFIDRIELRLYDHTTLPSPCH